MHARRQDAAKPPLPPRSNPVRCRGHPLRARALRVPRRIAGGWIPLARSMGPRRPALAPRPEEREEERGAGEDVERAVPDHLAVRGDDGAALGERPAERVQQEEEGERGAGADGGELRGGGERGGGREGDVVEEGVPGDGGR